MSELQVWKRMCRWRHMPFPTCWGRRKPNKKSKKGGAKDQFVYLRSLHNWVVYLKILLRENISTLSWKIGIETYRQILQRHLAQTFKFGKERVHHEVLSKSVRLMSVVLACRNSRKDHMRRPCTKKDAPAKQRGIWRNIFTSSRTGTKLCFFMFLVKLRRCRLPFQRDQRSENS